MTILSIKNVLILNQDRCELFENVSGVRFLCT